MADSLERAEEALLVCRAQSGEADAFRSLVELYDRRLLYYLRRLLDDPETSFDVLQEVWLQVHRHLHRLQSPQAFRVWLYRIAHHQAVSTLRRRQPCVPFDELTLEIVSDETTSDDLFESAELVHTALPALSLDHRQVLTLRFLEEMSVEEIAEVLGLATGTVKSRLHYAKAALRGRTERRHDG